MSASNDMLEHLKDIEQGLIGAALSVATGNTYMRFNRNGSTIHDTNISGTCSVS